MNVKVLKMSTFPVKSKNYWQVVVFPTISLYTSEYKERHISINFEWLFWTGTILLSKQEDCEEYIFTNTK